MAGNCLTQRWICRLHHGYALIELANCCFSFLIRWLLRITKKKAFSCWALIAHEHKNMIHNATIIGFFSSFVCCAELWPRRSFFMDRLLAGIFCLPSLIIWFTFWKQCSFRLSPLHGKYDNYFRSHWRFSCVFYKWNKYQTNIINNKIIWRMLICTHLLITTDHHCDCYEISEYVFAVQIWFRIFWIWFEGILGWRRKIPLELRPIHMQILCIRDRIEANESKIWTFISHRYAVECNFAMVDEKREWNFYFADNIIIMPRRRRKKRQNHHYSHVVWCWAPLRVWENLYILWASTSIICQLMYRLSQSAAVSRTAWPDWLHHFSCCAQCDDDATCLSFTLPLSLSLNTQSP